MIDRRTFIGSVVGGILTAPLAAEAQQAGKVYRIGALSVGWAYALVRSLYQDRLRQLGWTEKARTACS